MFRSRWTFLLFCGEVLSDQNDFFSQKDLKQNQMKLRTLNTH